MILYIEYEHQKLVAFLSIFALIASHIGRFSMKWMYQKASNFYRCCCSYHHTYSCTSLLTKWAEWEGATQGTFYRMPLKQLKLQFSRPCSFWLWRQKIHGKLTLHTRNRAYSPFHCTQRTQQYYLKLNTRFSLLVDSVWLAMSNCVSVTVFLSLSPRSIFFFYFSLFNFLKLIWYML